MAHLDEDLNLTRKSAVNSISPWPALAQWLGENKIDVIMSRGYGALDYIPEHPLVIVQRLWMMLSPEGGVMTLQIPPYQKLYGSVCILEWLDKLHKQKIQFSYVPSYFSSDFRYFGHAPEQYGLLELVKHDDRNLPALPREHRYVLGESNSFNSL